MKVAFHFNSEHPSLRSFYGHDIEQLLFGVLLKRRTLSVSSKVLTGDLLLSSLAEYERGNARYFNVDKYHKVIELWLHPENTVWSQMIYDRLGSALNNIIFTICFETIDLQLATDLSDELHNTSEVYLGALEVDEASPVHWHLYSNFISPRYRIINRTATVFWDGFSEDSRDPGLLERLHKFGFRQVEFESLNGRYTIFDEYHDFEHARRVAEWKRQCGSLLAFIADDVAHRLGDAAPDLGDKLWSMLKTFNEAETNEQLAQVTASCRRVIEYISDQLFPPIEGETGGYKLGAQHYRNRLLAFADKSRQSDTNVDLIWVSTKTLSEQIEKLLGLANKGVHAEIYRAETRRCLLRTILLLDDIISLKTRAFEIKPKLNFDGLIQHLKKDQGDVE